MEKEREKKDKGGVRETWMRRVWKTYRRRKEREMVGGRHRRDMGGEGDRRQRERGYRREEEEDGGNEEEISAGSSSPTFHQPALFARFHQPSCRFIIVFYFGLMTFCIMSLVDNQ